MKPIFRSVPALLLVFGFGALRSLAADQFPNPLEYQRELQRAELLLGSGDAASAMEAYRGLVQPGPASGNSPLAVQARLGLALSLEALGRPAEALIQLNSALAEGENTADSDRLIYHKARILRGTGQADEARNVLVALRQDEQRLHERSAGLWEAMLVLEYQLHRDLDRETEGYELFKASLNQSWYSEPNPKLEEQMARIMHERGAYEELRDFLSLRYTSLFGLDGPEETVLRFFLAEGLQGSGETAGALELYRSLIAGDHGYRVPSYIRLFDLLRDEQEESFSGELQRLLEQAEVDLRSTPLVLREFWERMLADSYARGDEERISYFLERLEQQPSGMQTYIPAYYRSRIRAVEDPQAALEYLDSYLESGGEAHPWIRLRQAELALGLEKYQQALEYHSMVDTGEYDRRSGLYRQWIRLGAVTLQRLGMHTEALALLRQDDSTDLLPLSARSLAALGRHREAASELDAFLGSGIGEDLFRRSLRTEYYQYLLRSDQTRVLITRQRQIREAEGFFAYPEGEYLFGIAHLMEGRYPEAKAIFARLMELGNLGLIADGQLKAYISYYLAWTHYRAGEDAQAISLYRQVLADPDGSDFSIRAAYEAAWSAIRMQDYDLAREFALSVRNPDTVDRGDSESPADENLEFITQGSYLLAKIHRLQGDDDSALTALDAFRRSFPRHEFADDALYDRAMIHLDRDELAQAVRALDEFVALYPSSSLAPAAAYRSANASFEMERWAEARSAFNRYRSLFPTGRNVDAALYFSGRASWELDERGAAQLYWNNLINAHEGSYFRAGGMLLLAQLYGENGEYQKSADLYRRYQAEYPLEAANLNIAERIREAQGALQGLAPREAQLWSIISADTNLGSRAAVNALLELGRIIIIEKAGLHSRRSEVLRLLDLLSARDASDPVAAAGAYYLKGRWRLQEGSWDQAGENFLLSAVLDPRNEEAASRSLYFALESAYFRGRRANAEAIYAQMTDLYGESPWTIQAAQILGRENNGGSVND